MKFNGLIVFLVSLVSLVSVAYGQSSDVVELNKSLSCRGPGFDYAELDVDVKDKMVDVRMAHYFFDLQQKLQESGMSHESSVREIRLSFKKSDCRALKSDPTIMQCRQWGPNPLQVELYDYNNEFLSLVEVPFVRIQIQKRQALDHIDRGTFAIVNMSLSNGANVLDQANISDHPMDDPVLGEGCRVLGKI